MFDLKQGEYHIPFDYQMHYRTSSEILAAAALELFSDLELISGGTTPLGFYYDFAFNQPITSECLPFLEERMRFLIAKDVPIQSHAMIPSNAAAFLRHHKHYYRALCSEKSSDPLVEVFQLGGFVDLCPGSYLETTGEVGKVKLTRHFLRAPLNIKGKEKLIYRIEGCAFPTKKELGYFLKMKKELEEGDHRVVGKQLGLFDLMTTREKDGSERCYCLWQEAGLDRIAALANYGKAIYQKRGFKRVARLDLIDVFFQDKVSMPLRFFSLDHHQATGEIDPNYGLYLSKDSYKESAYTLCLKEDLVGEVISSLKFLQKIPKMFGFEAEVILLTKPGTLNKSIEKAMTSAQIEVSRKHSGKDIGALWMIVDRFGQKWQGPFLRIEKRGEHMCIMQSLFGRIERFVAMLLESKNQQLSQKKDFLDKLEDLTSEWKSDFENE